jgi:hypothetical protein
LLERRSEVSIWLAQALLRGPSPLRHGWLSRAVPASVGRSREQAVSRLRVPVPSGRGRLGRSGPPRPGTELPAGHGKADESRDPLHAMQFRAPPPPQVRDRRPAQRSSPSDRGCPWIPLVTAACGTRVARPVRTTMLEPGGDGSSAPKGRGPSSVTRRLVGKSPEGSRQPGWEDSNSGRLPRCGPLVAGSER